MNRGKQIIDLTKRMALFLHEPQELKLTFHEHDDVRIAASPDEGYRLISTEDRSKHIFGKLNGVTLKWAE